MKFKIICAFILFFLCLIGNHFIRDMNINSTASKDAHRSIKNEFKSNEKNAEKSTKNDVTETKFISKSTTEEGVDSEFSDEEFAKIIKEGEATGVTYISVESLNDKEYKAEIKRVIQNLKEKGSTSGGVREGEFANLETYREALKRNGIHNMIARLDQFKSTPDSILSRHQLKLTGAMNFGEFDSDIGWSGIYKLYENGNKKVEIQQMSIIAGKASQHIVKEILNITLDRNTPAIYEILKNDEIQSLTFVSDRNFFQMNAQHLSREQFFDIANRIIQNPEK